MKRHLRNEDRWGGVKKSEMCLQASFFFGGGGAMMVQGKVWPGTENSSLGGYGGQETVELIWGKAEGGLGWRGSGSALQKH